jgi:hypothetical protein
MPKIEAYTMIKDQLGKGQVQLYKECRRLVKREEVRESLDRIYDNIQLGISTFDAFRVCGDPFDWNTQFKTDERGEGVIAFIVEGVRIFDLYSDLQTINVYHARVCKALLTELLNKED